MPLQQQTGKQIEDHSLELKDLPLAPGPDYLLIADADRKMVFGKLALDANGSILVTMNGDLIYF